mmetsp:Transcript_21532/g.31283  ORF Transcript_21532/g.31283 Transcript_21532/m.31283 type:complete len:224 (+) Transcript_21532:72-743(+)
MLSVPCDDSDASSSQGRVNEALRYFCLSKKRLDTISENDIRKLLFKSMKNDTLTKEISEAHGEVLLNYINSARVSDPMDLETQIGSSLYLAPHTVARDKYKLEQLGITSILSMTAECGPQYPNNFNYHHEPLIEHTCSIEDVLEVLDRSIVFVQSELSNSPQNKVLIHCVQGKTRSASIATYFIATSTGISVYEAYDKIRQRRDIYIPEQWLEKLESHLNSKG